MSEPTEHSAADGTSHAETTDSPRYAKPKVMLIDLDDDCLTAVKEAGFNAVAGTFGAPILTNGPSGWQNVPPEPLPTNHTEQEVVVVDLTAPASEAHHVPPLAGDGIFVKSWTRSSDQRPINMLLCRVAFNRILACGGVFVVFAAPREKLEYRNGRVQAGRESVDTRRLWADTWSFLSLFESMDLGIRRDTGEEMKLYNVADHALRPLSGLLTSGQFTTTFRWPAYRNNEITPIIANKYDQCVGLLLEGEKHAGAVLVLPQLSNRAGLLVRLLQEYLPHLRPGLFPDFVGQRWAEQPEYELQPVLELQEKKRKTIRKAEEQINQLDAEIQDHRSQSGYLHSILTDTGRKLELAVITSLEIFFAKVIDADAETDGNPQEDLRIEDGSQMIVVEIKGLAGQPTESDAIQVLKYSSRRMREHKGADVRGLVIVNHQRQIPPLDRDNENAFTAQQVTDAEQNAYTLVTTWDLFRLIRGMQDHGWPARVIRDLMICSGRMPAIPSHYEPVGKVARFWPEAKVVSIDVEGAPVAVGDRLAYACPSCFLEEEIKSMEIDNGPVELASSGQRAGIETVFDKSQLRKGTLVYHVLPTPADPSAEATD
ncbi:MAG: hypothetical protein GY842_03315 [bacterium]|nr:hypothetical protein [bacterium]